MDSLFSKNNNEQIIKAALFFIFFALVFSVSTAFAGTPSPSPGFNQTVNGLTNLHSNNDYGQRIINWIAFGKPDNVKFGEASLLSTISFTLNAIALVMMAYLSILGGVTYVIQTANKGTPGGQVISSFWMPIRIATATILLVPLASGYSTIQYGVITIAEKGNAHGSYLMNQGIDYIAKNGVYRPPVMESNKDVVIGLVWTELCRIHVNTTENNQNAIKVDKKYNVEFANESYIYSYDKQPPTSSGFAGFMKRLTSSPKPAYCGSVSISIPDANMDSFLVEKGGRTSPKLFKTADYEDDASILATSSLIHYLETTVMPAAKAIAIKLSEDGNALALLQRNGGRTAQSNYERLRENADKAPESASSDLNKLIGDFDQKLQQIIQRSIISVNTHNTTSSVDYSATNESTKGTAPWVKQIKDTGWPALGTVFWQISKNQQALNYLAKRMKVEYSEPKMDEEYVDDERYLTLYARLSDLINSSKGDDIKSGTHVFDMSAISMAGADGSAGYLKSYVAGKFQSLMLAMFIPDDDGDLITKLQYSGSVLAATTDLLMHAAIWNNAISKTMGDTSEAGYMAGVISAASAPVVGAISGAAAALGLRLLATPVTFLGHLGVGYMEFMSNFALPLLIAGFALAIVLPAIPLFFWLMGVVSWMIFFVECLLVSPMWLAAHGTAEKDGWGSEHTRQGYMLMIGLYLNPILRVAGFFAIFLVLIPLGRMAGWLSQYLTGVLASGWLSPALIVGAMIMLAVFAYSAAVRVFSLPNELFERGLRWVNGGNEVTGDSGAEHQNRMIIAQIGTQGSSAAGAASKALKERPKTPKSNSSSD